MAILGNQYVDRTGAITQIPFKPNLMSALGFFREETANADSITFDERENSLVVLDDHQRNVDKKNGLEAKEYKPHLLAIPHYPVESTITVRQLKGIRNFDTDVEQAIEGAVAEDLEKHAEKHDNHLEYLRALMVCQGIISTTNFGDINMFTEFDVTKQTSEIDFADTAPFEPQMRAVTNLAKKGIRNGGRISGYVVLCGVDYFTRVTNHADVRDGYVVAGQNSPLRNQLGEIGNGYAMFTYGNITFIQYDDVFTKADGTTSQPLGDDEAVLLPRSVLGSTFFGPVSKLSGVGAAGAKRFASSYRDPKDRFVEMESEQNTLVLLQEIGAVVWLTAKA